MLRKSGTSIRAHSGSLMTVPIFQPIRDASHLNVFTKAGMKELYSVSVEIELVGGSTSVESVSKYWPAAFS
jgi:hypothetical protein